METGEIEFHNFFHNSNSDTTDTSIEETTAETNEEGTDTSEDGPTIVETEEPQTEEPKAEVSKTKAKKPSKWTKEYFVDEFGDPDRNKPYVCEKNTNEGTFKNTTTNGSKLYAGFIVDDHNVTLVLYEYGTHLVVNASSYSSDEYDVKFKDEDGNVTECFGISYPNSNRIWLVNDTSVTNAKNSTDDFTLDDSSKILALFNKDQKLSVAVTERDGMSSYLFKMDTTGFKKTFAWVFPEQSAKASSYTDAETIKRVQNALNEAGFNCGTADGIAGPATYNALNAYQEAHGLPVENLITDDLLATMGLN